MPPPLTKLFKLSEDTDKIMRDKFDLKYPDTEICIPVEFKKFGAFGNWNVFEEKVPLVKRGDSELMRSEL